MFECIPENVKDVLIKNALKSNCKNKHASALVYNGKIISCHFNDGYIHSEENCLRRASLIYSQNNSNNKRKAPYCLLCYSDR